MAAPETAAKSAAPVVRGIRAAALKVQGHRLVVDTGDSQFTAAATLYAEWPWPQTDLGLNPESRHFLLAVSRVIMNWSPTRLTKVQAAADYLKSIA